MKQQTSSSSLIVTQLEQARFLLDPLQRRYLEPFVAQALTIKQAAQEIEVRPNTLLYAVRRMLACGLLMVTQVQQRKGRAVRVYRSSADVFFLPHTAIAQGGLEETIAQLDFEGEQLLRHNMVLARNDKHPSWGFRIFRNERGQVSLNSALDPDQNLDWLALDAPAAFSLWFSSLQLDFADAKALQRELFAVLERYQNKQGGQTYLMRLGMAPLTKNHLGS